jgi:hypothetical protein
VHVPVVGDVQGILGDLLHKQAELSEERYPVTLRLKTPPANVP